MAKVNKNTLVEKVVANPKIAVTPAAVTTTGSHGGGGASRVGTQPVQTVAATKSNPILAGNYGDTMSNVLGNSTAYAVNAASGNLSNQDVLNRKQTLNAYASQFPPTPAEPANPGSGDGNGGGGGGLSVSQMVSDPYADIYALYESQLNAQRDALEQQRAARRNALQANYNNARSQLDSSFASGETEMNQTADKALREAYINNMLNQRSLNQQLANQGITGGALESILARAYNTYGNNRNEIENNRMDQLRQLLANYQGTLGDIENSYLTGMADADSDYSGSIANALSSYYSNLADLQKQNIANQYKAALSKSGSSSTKNTADTGTSLDSNILKGLKSYKDYASAKRYLDYKGVPESEQEAYFMESGQGGLLGSEEATQAAVSSVSPTVRNNVLNTLRQVASLSRGTNDLEKNVAAQMDQLVRTYGLSDAQARA